MKKLQDLKQEILNGKINNFYVFYGEDYGLRQHYINAIAQNYTKIVYIQNYLDFSDQAGSSLLPTKYLYLIYNCIDFCTLTIDQINKFKQKILDNCVIFDFDSEQEQTTLFKEESFKNNITYFPLVNDNIGLEFVLSEINLNTTMAKNLAYNCQNNYNDILLETNKIKNYAEGKKINISQAYESLDTNKQLITKLDDYNNDLLVEDLLTCNSKNFIYWETLIKQHTDIYSKLKQDKENKFLANLTKTVNDFIIAYLLKRYGKYDGGSIAYNNKLSWTRTKRLRELKIPYSADDLFYFIYELCDLNYKVRMGKINESDAFNYFVYSVL